MARKETVGDNAYMVTTAKIALFFGSLLFSLTALAQDSAARGPQYTSNGQLQLPEHYREWVYLTSGFDMSYSAPMQMGGHHVFDNVFVNPDGLSGVCEDRHLAGPHHVGAGTSRCAEQRLDQSKRQLPGRPQGDWRCT